MDIVYRNFYRSCYIRTGFIPTQPMNQGVYPGDFFQISNGQMVLLGNIFREHVINREDAVFGNSIKLTPAAWIFNDGVTKPYSSRGTGHGPMGGEFEFSKQLLGFDDRGSFIFRANEPESVKIRNWNEIQQQLIIKMTQTVFSFRELYVVTESAAPADWTLAIAGAGKADLEISTEADNFGLVDIFGDASARTILSKDIEYYYREPKKRPCFFKAKKLVVQEERLDVFVSELITRNESQHEWASSFFDYGFQYEPVYSPHDRAGGQAGVLDMLQANDLNPNTALLYFRWSDANLDDIEKLFRMYG